MKNLYLLLIALVFIVSCKDDSNSPIETKNEISYSYPPPQGKLPFPQHNPQFVAIGYNDMMSKLWIINNFALWNGSEEKIYDCYHDGLDIVLDNGTKLYSVEAGYARAVINSTLLIEDKDEPGYGWGYTHVNNISVNMGDAVSQGQFIATINFVGLAHVHLTRYKLMPGRSWDSFSNLEGRLPDQYFDIPDSIPPVIRTPFYYFRDNSDEIIDSVPIPTVSGKVDIVVPMRDPGEKYHNATGFGDRNCVCRIEYEISSDNGVKYSKQSHDFSKIVTVYNSEAYKKVQTIFKSVFRFKPLPLTGSKTFNYYIITNWDENHQLGEMTTADENGCWNTAELNTDGTRKFPNGTYKVKVTAYDFHNNSTSEEQSVKINN